MQSQTIGDFLTKTAESDHSENNEAWELENERILEIRMYNKTVWMKAGAMIAYKGGMRFTRERMLEHGASRFFKQFFSGEGSTLSKAQGSGRLYLADQGKKIILLQLDNDAVTVNGNDVLAFDSGLNWDIRLMKKVGGMLTAGLFNMRFEGTGLLAITSHFDPMTIATKAGRKVVTDPNATVAWSANLEPDLRLDVSLRTFLGRGSGDSVQMVFDGDGFVVVQSVENRPMAGRR